MTLVPNRFPTLPSNYRVAVIGEAPGADEEKLGQPFVGMSGRFLAALLSRAGIAREACFLGNICQHRPPGNDITKFDWNGLEIQHGLTRLKEDLEAFKPNVCVLLGNTPLKAAKDFYTPKLGVFKVSNWRGSLFRCEEKDSPFFNQKCLPAYHPAYALRDYEVTPLLQFDLKKAVKEGVSPRLELPKRDLYTDRTADQIINLLQHIRLNKTPVAIDIEGGVDSLSCISFAVDPNIAFIVPFTRKDNTRVFPPDEEKRIWRELALTLEDSNVPKVLQNSLYDRFVLQYSYGIRVAGIRDDTMLKHWELYAELEKSLGVQTSLYTNEPYYKGERKSNDDKTFYEYCCRDSAVTLEISNKLGAMLKGSSLDHYRLNLTLLNPLLYMELRGIRYDERGARERRLLLRSNLYESQARLNALTGHTLTWKSKQEIYDRSRSLMWTKKGDRVRKEYEQDYSHLLALLHLRVPSLATIGEIENLLEVSLNVDSTNQIQTYLYETLKLPVQHTTPKKGEEPRPTADYEALLKLSRWCQQQDLPHSYQIIQSAIIIRALGTRQQMLGISADKDGRIRCGYNIVGSNTGRITCYESPTGSGYNLQTIPNYTEVSEAPGSVMGDRDLFLADEGAWFFQCDLAGADGWTVAAYSAMLGDDTMLLDYLYGLRPFNNLCLKLRGTNVDFSDREALKHEGKKIPKDAWDRFACKRVQHGGSYLEGGLTISRNILKDSEGKLYMTPSECEKLKDFFFQRYWGVKKWHDWIAARIKARPVLTAASGQVRQFFGRPDEILTKAVAFEPQANTTYATNLAMYRLWTDFENREYQSEPTRNLRESRPNETVFTRMDLECRLRVEPLHQVHDALCGQFKKTDTPWAISKIKSWFDNTLVIAGQKIVIPFDGGYGESWGNLNAGKI